MAQSATRIVGVDEIGWTVGVFHPAQPIPLTPGSDAFCYPGSPTSQFIGLPQGGMAVNLANGRLTQSPLTDDQVHFFLWLKGDIAVGSYGTFPASSGNLLSEELPFDWPHSPAASPDRR